MTPHPQHLHHAYVLHHLIAQPVLDVDAPGAGSAQIAHKGYVGRWLLVGISQLTSLVRCSVLRLRWPFPPGSTRASRGWPTDGAFPQSSVSRPRKSAPRRPACLGSAPADGIAPPHQSGHTGACGLPWRTPWSQGSRGTYVNAHPESRAGAALGDALLRASGAAAPFHATARPESVGCAWGIER